MAEVTKIPADPTEQRLFELLAKLRTLDRHDLNAWAELQQEWDQFETEIDIPLSEWRLLRFRDRWFGELTHNKLTNEQFTTLKVQLDYKIGELATGIVLNGILYETENGSVPVDRIQFLFASVEWVNWSMNNRRLFKKPRKARKRTEP